MCTSKLPIFRLLPVYVNVPGNLFTGSRLPDSRTGADNRSFAFKCTTDRVLRAGIREDDSTDAAFDCYQRRLDLDDHPALRDGKRPLGIPGVNLADQTRLVILVEEQTRRIGKEEQPLRAELDRQRVAVDVDWPALFECQRRRGQHGQIVRVQ